MHGRSFVSVIRKPGRDLADSAVAGLMLGWSGLALRRKKYWPAGFNLWFPGACALLWPTLAVQSFTRLRRHQRAIGTGSGNASL